MSKYFSKEKFKYPFYVLTHPIDGYYEIRHRDRGSVPIALLIVLLFAFSYVINQLTASFIVSDVNPREVNSLSVCFGIFLIFILFCIANWSITCLMEGEGRLKDIVIAIGYALVPCVLTYIPATIVSQFVAENEVAFYNMIISIGVAYAVILALMGIMTVHNYTLGKTLITVFLTFVAMLIIIFLIMLFYSLIQQLVMFISSIYTELIFRT